MYNPHNLKYANRREKLKKLQNPLIALGRKWTKASPLVKVSIGAGILIPKALFLTAAYLAGKSPTKEKKESKKYMIG